MIHVYFETTREKRKFDLKSDLHLMHLGKWINLNSSLKAHDGFDLVTFKLCLL